MNHRAVNTNSTSDYLFQNTTFDFRSCFKIRYTNSNSISSCTEILSYSCWGIGKQRSFLFAANWNLKINVNCKRYNILICMTHSILSPCTTALKKSSQTQNLVCVKLFKDSLRYIKCNKLPIDKWNLPAAFQVEKLLFILIIFFTADWRPCLCTKIPLSLKIYFYVEWEWSNESEVLSVLTLYWQSDQQPWWRALVHIIPKFWVELFALNLNQ